MRFYITFKMDTHIYEATHLEESGFEMLKTWIIANSNRIKTVIKVISSDEEQSSKLLNDIKIIIQNTKK